MRSAWLLPEHVADVLPVQAERIEQLRRRWLDLAAARGFRLVIPPLVEHLESLLSGTGTDLDLRTFKLVDQMSGRTIGVRADTTPQAARIDAHLLNEEGLTRLCYCGPVLHTRPAAPAAGREPLQFGAELFGHAGLEADLEVIELALEGIVASGAGAPVIDLADARVLRGVLAGVPLEAERLAAIAAALAVKDQPSLEGLLSGVSGLPEPAARALRALPGLYGGVEVIEAARAVLPPRPLISAALEDLARLARRLEALHRDLRIGLDLSDLGGYAYYSGPRFACYVGGHREALLRGGRYDEVGAVFGRSRPAVGFSLDLKALAEALPGAPVARPAVFAPWADDPTLDAAVRRVREAGESVVRGRAGDVPPACDRELAGGAGRWAVRARAGGPTA
jgi:ATP phosphoribosyltransferase regulatory subunit